MSEKTRDLAFNTLEFLNEIYKKEEYTDNEEIKFVRVKDTFSFETKRTIYENGTWEESEDIDKVVLTFFNIYNKADFLKAMKKQSIKLSWIISCLRTYLFVADNLAAI